ncbi:MAG: hypothetical protein JNJ73_07850 [Hyphomonadaceae bacterium]|nr:hypothetical protein [Hyphomonadaceae bacterium]
MPKDRDKLERQMAARGWTYAQIDEAKAAGQTFPVANNETGEPATRYIHPDTGRSVIIDDEAGEILHVGGDGFVY